MKFQIEIPGSKSYTNRVLFIAAMIDSPVKILNPLICDDTKAMTNCLMALKVSNNLNAHLSGTRFDWLVFLKQQGVLHEQ